MPTEEVKEMRDWSARFMGWVWVKEHKIWVLNSERDADGRLTNCTPNELSHHHSKWGKYIQQEWRPDEDLNQTKMIWERMRGLGWELWLIETIGGKTAATFCKYETRDEAHLILDNVHDWIWDFAPQHAIIKAAILAYEMQ